MRADRPEPAAYGKIRARAIVGHAGYSLSGSGSGIVESVQDFTAPPPVLGTGNVWLAGLASGTARNTDTSANASPTPSLAAPVPGQDLTFTITGGTHNSPVGPGSTGPDGILFITHDEENAIAPLTAPINALVGIFLDGSAPAGATPLPYLDYTAIAAREARRYAPSLRQPFFIGDGRTTAGASQVFRVPAGATRLFLGSFDTFDNNSNYGAFEVSTAAAPSIDTVAPPPNLASWWPGENTAWDVMGIGRGSMKNATRSSADAYLMAWAKWAARWSLMAWTITLRDAARASAWCRISASSAGSIPRRTVWKQRSCPSATPTMRTSRMRCSCAAASSCISHAVRA